MKTKTHRCAPDVEGSETLHRHSNSSYKNRCGPNTSHLQQKSYWGHMICNEFSLFWDERQYLAVHYRGAFTRLFPTKTPSSLSFRMDWLGNILAKLYPVLTHTSHDLFKGHQHFSFISLCSSSHCTNKFIELKLP